MIICCFPGVGRTYCADNIPRVFDVGNKYNYDVFDLIEQMDYDVLADIRCVDGLKSKGKSFIVVIPSIHSKDEYIKRYKKMGKSEDFIQDMKEHWEEKISKYLYDYDLQLETLQEGQYLSNRFLRYSSGFKDNFGISLIDRNELKNQLRKLDSFDWDYEGIEKKVMDIINDQNEYMVSRKEAVKCT